MFTFYPKDMFFFYAREFVFLSLGDSLYPMDMEKQKIIDYFKDLSFSGGEGLESLFSTAGNEEIFERIVMIGESPLSKVQLNQLFSISGLPGMTFGFFRYYWLSTPEMHTYNTAKVDGYKEEFLRGEFIRSLDHLHWGLKRIYFDSLLYFGNISNGYRILSKKNESELIVFFKEKRFDTETIKRRGEALDFEFIEKEDRYLISEMACKTYEAPDEDENNLKNFLIENYTLALKQGRKKPKIKDLLEGKYLKEEAKNQNTNILQLKFSAEDIMEKEIENEADIDRYYGDVARRFTDSRKKAVKNTKYYLSLVSDLDVYVATSMRTKEDFVEMANTCEKIFHDPKIADLHLRYFDPTISAANGHEDKGLIECLMVKAAKALIYTSGTKESYGKDAEAAMALSSGKPVIFYSTDPNKANFYKHIHPLTKLIDFSTGIANGAVVTFSLDQLVEIIRRLFANEMEYTLDQEKPGYFRLKEKLTDSIVRVQTNDVLLYKSFWNYFTRMEK